MTVNEDQDEYRQATEATTEQREGEDYLTNGAGAPISPAEADAVRAATAPDIERIREGLLAEAEAEVAALPRDPETGEWADIPLNNCQLEFVIPVHGVSDLSEALDVAAVSLIRLGMDSFHIRATDPDTGQSWVVHNGEVWSAEDYLNGASAPSGIQSDVPATE